MKVILQTPDRQHGTVLILALIFMVVMANMVYSALESAQLAERLNFTYTDRARALYAAESSLLVAERQMLAKMQAYGLQVLPGLPAQLTQDQYQQLAIAGFGGSVDSGFSDLLRSPEFFLEFVWKDEASEVAGSTHELFCGPVFRVSARGYGKAVQSDVHLTSEWHACCVVGDECEFGVLQLRNRDLRELIP